MAKPSVAGKLMSRNKWSLPGEDSAAQCGSHRSLAGVHPRIHFKSHFLYLPPRLYLSPHLKLYTSHCASVIP